MSFYTDHRKFNPATDNIQIRVNKRAKKNRPNHSIVVEDPFDLSHNLTAGVHKHSKFI